MAEEIYKYEENVNVRDTAMKFQFGSSSTMVVSSKKAPLHQTPTLQVDKVIQGFPAVQNTEIMELNQQLPNKESRNPLDSNSDLAEDKPVNVKYLLKVFSCDKLKETSSETSLPPNPTVPFNDINYARHSEVTNNSQLASCRIEIASQAVKKPIEARIKPTIKSNSIFGPNNLKIPNGDSIENEKERNSSNLDENIQSKFNKQIEGEKELSSDFNHTGNGITSDSDGQLRFVSRVKEIKDAFSKIPKLETNNITQKPKFESRVSKSSETSTISSVDDSDLFKNGKNTILILGLAQSGKSSLVNHLLQQNLCPIYKSPQRQEQITECTAILKDYGPITLLDTPGFTDNLTQNLSICATLNSYFPHGNNNGNHPTLILALLNYEAHFKFAARSTLITNFFQLLFHYHANEYNSKPRIQFVMTHSTKLDQSSMTQIAEYFMDLAQGFMTPSTISNNPTLAFHSKEATSHAQDLFETMRQNSNLLWEEAFGSNYPGVILSSCVTNSIPMPSTPARRLSKLLTSIFPQAAGGSGQSEISTLLEIGWENIDINLRAKYPSSLVILQQVLESNGIRTFEDLPSKPHGILELLYSLPHHDPTTADLCNETLQLQIPYCYAAQYIGQGYDVSKDQVTRVSPFEFSGLLQTSAVGLLPEQVSCKVMPDEREIIFKFYETFEDFAQDRFWDLGLSHAKFIAKNNSMPSSTNTRKGYNVINDLKTSSTNANATIEYRIFQLSLENLEEIQFKPKFWNALVSLPELEPKNAENVESWNQFFCYWGTHVVKSAYGGGAIDVNFRGKILNPIWKGMKERSLDRMEGLETSDVFDWITEDNLASASNSRNSDEFFEGYDVSCTFVGGDIRFQQQDLTKLESKMVGKMRNEWIQSLPLSPVILESNLGLVPLSYFVRTNSEEMALKIDKAFLHFYDGFMVSGGKGCTIL